MAMIKEYFELTKKYKTEYGEKTVVLYQVGQFMELYALLEKDGTYSMNDIEDFTKINDMAIGNKHCQYNNKAVMMAGVGVPYVDKYIQRTQEHGYTIVIYKQDTNAKNTTRSLSEIISPGTFFPLDGEGENNNISYLNNSIMCIWIHKTNVSRFMPPQVIIGIAIIDIFTGRTSLSQFSTDCLNSHTSYDELERYISAYRPSECLLSSNLPEKTVDDIINFVGLETVKLHKLLFDGVEVERAMKQNYQQETFKRFFPHLDSSSLFADYYLAAQSFCYLLNFVYRHNPNLVNKLNEPIFENKTERLILANHTLKQLNIIDDSRHTGKFRSVINLLNNCVTTMGQRRFLYSLHYPTTDENTLQSSYDITEHLLSGSNQVLTWQTIRTKLNSIGDLEKFMRKVVNRKVLPKNLLSLVEDLKVIRSLYNYIQEDGPLLKYLHKQRISVSITQACSSIIDDISSIFNLEQCRSCAIINETTFIINRSISTTLDNLLRDSLDGQDKLEAIRAFFSNLIQTPLEKEKAKGKESSHVKLHETAKSAATLIATSRRAVLLKDALKKYNKTSVTLSYPSKYSLKEETFDLYLSTLEYVSGTSKNDVVITSQQIKSISSLNEEVNIKLVKEMELIFQRYINEFAKYDEQMQSIINYTSEMDLLQNKCYIAHKYNYCKPQIVSGKEGTSSFFSFTGIRHPLIEHLQSEELYVTNDLALGTNYTESDTVSPYFTINARQASPIMRGSVGQVSPAMGGCGGLAPRGVLLYGTNAVGKTSFIKSIGIAVIMAQAGLYVPALTFLFKPYQTIFTRILGNDNLFKGLSTFAVEMTELRSILTMADKNSLVLGDELCSGTESDSALSIFTAGLEILHEKKCTFLFATHFHEVSNYDEIKALDKLKMMHMAVHYNKETNALVYDRKLREGAGESMYGLEVCKSLHLPDAFLRRAHDIRMKYNEEQQSVLSYSPSHFNARKIVGLCELCNAKKASEVHHLQHQKDANTKNDYIGTFHKNHLANLLNICEACHQKIHKSGQQHKVVKTLKGSYILEKI